MGSNAGFNKETTLIKSINNKSLKEMDTSSVILLKKLFPNYNLQEIFFSCYKNEGRGLEKKTDITIEAGNLKKINISLKSGSNNSVHQENIFSFLSLLKESLPNFNESDKNLILKFHWCDGTLDNSGLVINRSKKKDFIKKFCTDYDLYSAFFGTIKDLIFDRIMVGSINSPEYLVYANSHGEYLLSSMTRIKKKHLDHESEWGLFTLQNCWACLGGQDHGHESHVCDYSCPKIKPKAQKHRQDIQFKWSNIENCLLNE